MTKAMSDGGKGSVRRNEDTQKVLEGFTRIFGESKLDKRLREEREAKECMKDLYDDAAGEAEDYEERSDEDELCDLCNGTGEGMWDGASCPKCHGTGMMPRDDVDDDYV